MAETVPFVYIPLKPLHQKLQCGSLVIPPKSRMLSILREDHPQNRELLAQWPITLVLMMINSYSLVLMILCLFSLRFMIKILVGVQLQQRIQSQVLELARFDSRSYASRPHQVLKRSLAHWIKFWTKLRKKKKIFK